MAKRRKARFREGQVVSWWNGVYRYFRIAKVNPLHCADGCFSYQLDPAPLGSGGRTMVEYSPWACRPYDLSQVSEDVLRPLTARERDDRKKER